MKNLILSLIFLSVFFYLGKLTSPYLLNSLIKDPEIILDLEYGKIYKNIDDYFGDSLFLKMETFRITEGLTDEQKAGMLLMPAYEKNNTISDLENWVENYKIGGFMVLHGQINKEQISQIKNRSFQNVQLPLFVSLDAEPSLVRNRVSQLSDISKTSDIKNENEVIDQADKISSYLYENGYNLNFAPVYDNDENKSVIGDRSFGQNIEMLAGLFSEISKENKVLSTAKHFPGHGSVSGDTHLSLQVIKDTLPEIENFKSAIENKTPFVMVGHLAVDSEDKSIDTNGLPATLSKNITSDLLVKDLGFKGLVVTDAMNMGALNQFENLNVEALKAGVDILLMPRDLKSAHSEILNEMQSSDEFEKLVDQKIRKIVRMKLVLNWIE